VSVKRLGLAAICALAALFPTVASASDKSTSDKLIIDEPTFICLGVEWYVKGDDNGNAAVEFHYRRAGDSQWREAMPLWRVDTTSGRRPIPAGDVLFAGSIFNLEQGTKYEMKLSLKDPDGGDAEKIVTAMTRAEPLLPKNARIRYVVPGDGGGSGTKADPFKGLKSADAAAQPGDVMQLASGTYQGPWTVTKSGVEGRPIIWLGPSDNSAIIDGNWAERAVSAEGCNYVWYWHLSITKAENALVAHRASYVVMRYCHVYDTSCGFVATNNPMKGNVVLDSVFEGRVAWVIDGKRTRDPNIIIHLSGKRYDITDMNAVIVSGEGTVAAFNRMRYWGDGIHGSGDQPKVADDFYGNEISECGDDGIECDEGSQNIRCFENRMTNFLQGVSTQPVHGGPVYVFRNALYNMSIEPFKLHNSPHGVLLINNTSVRADIEPGPMFVWTSDPIYHIWAGNNLFVGGGDRRALEMSPPINSVSFDYNGYAGGPWTDFAKWNGKVYHTLKDFQTATKEEEHAVILPVKGLFATGVTLPESADKMVDIAVNDLRLAGGTAAIDAGYVFPGITDGYKGKAPDLGAYELGSELPHYGPRLEK